MLDTLLKDISLVATDPERLWDAVHAAGAASDDWTVPEVMARPAALDLIRAESARLTELPGATLAKHLDATLLSDHPGRELDLLQRLGILAVLLPEVDALVGFHRSSASHHKDLWDHTRRVIAQMPRDADLRWAALLHDIGKIATRVDHRPGNVTFWRHEALGAWLSRGAVARFLLPAKRAARIVFVVEYHGRVNAYDTEWSDRAVRRLAREMGPGLADLIAFSKADFTTKRSSRRVRIRKEIQHLEERLDTLRRAAAAAVLPSGLGRLVGEATGLSGPELGRAMSWLLTELRAGAVTPEPQELVDHLAAFGKTPRTSFSRTLPETNPH